MRQDTKPVAVFIPGIGNVTVIGACVEEDKYLRLICRGEDKQEFLLNLNTVQVSFDRGSWTPF